MTLITSTPPCLRSFAAATETARPCNANELPADLDGFLKPLNVCFDAMPPFPLDLDRLHLTPDGRMLALGTDPAPCDCGWPSAWYRSRVLDRPIDTVRLACDPGQSSDAHEPFATEAEQAGFEHGWVELQASSLGAVEVGIGFGWCTMPIGPLAGS